MRDEGGYTAEIKFLVSEEIASAIRDWVRTDLVPDPYSVGGEILGYRTSTLYFDTESLDLLNRRGSTGRAKFRIRRYNDGPIVFLERKQKVEGRLTKRRSEVRLEELNQIALEAGADWSGRWFERRLRHRNLLPMCQIDYRRAARIGVSAGSPVRLTIDSELSAQPVQSITFSQVAGMEVLAGAAILELKHHGVWPPLFERLVDRFGLERQTFSKYRAAARMLGFAEEVLQGQTF